MTTKEKAKTSKNRGGRDAGEMLVSKPVRTRDGLPNNDGLRLEGKDLGAGRIKSVRIERWSQGSERSLKMQHRPPSTAWEDANKKRRRQIINDGERVVRRGESTDNGDSHARGRQLGALVRNEAMRKGGWWWCEVVNSGE